MTTYIRSEDIVQREIAGESLLVPIRGDLVTDQRVFTLNEVGKFIWNQMDGPSECSDLVQKVIAQFKVEKDVAERDVQDFLTQMEKRHLIHGGH